MTQRSVFDYVMLSALQDGYTVVNLASEMATIETPNGEMDVSVSFVVEDDGVIVVRLSPIERL